VLQDCYQRMGVVRTVKERGVILLQ